MRPQAVAKVCTSHTVPNMALRAVLLTSSAPDACPCVIAAHAIEKVDSYSKCACLSHMLCAQGASFKTQANALLRKSAIYQKRNIGTNCCLLSAPIFFCLLLLLIRILVNTLFLSGPNFEVRHAGILLGAPSQQP